MGTAVEEEKLLMYRIEESKECWLKDTICSPRCIAFREGCLLIELLTDIAVALRELR